MPFESTPGVVIEIRVPAEAAGMRLDRVLADAAAAGIDPDLPHLSRSRLQRLIAQGLIRIAGEAVRASLPVRGDEVVVVVLPPPVPLALAPEPMDLDVLYEDGDILALCKPAGLVVHPGAGQASGTLVNGLLAHCRDLSGIGGALRPGIVHRLDRGTSGVMVIAKNDAAHRGLAGQFASRAVRKRYVAFVIGEPMPARATIETGFGRHPTDRKRFTGRATPAGQPTAAP